MHNNKLLQLYSYYVIYSQNTSYLKGFSVDSQSYFKQRCERFNVTADRPEQGFCGW